MFFFNVVFGKQVQKVLKVQSRADSYIVLASGI